MSQEQLAGRTRKPTTICCRRTCLTNSRTSLWCPTWRALSQPARPRPSGEPTAGGPRRPPRWNVPPLTTADAPQERCSDRTRSDTPPLQLDRQGCGLSTRPVDGGPTPPAARVPARAQGALRPEPAAPWPNTTRARNAAHDARANAPLKNGLSRRVFARRVAIEVAHRPRHHSPTRWDLCDAAPLLDIAAGPVHARSPPSFWLNSDDKHGMVLLHQSTLWNMIVTLLRHRNTHVRTRSRLGSSMRVAGLPTSVRQSDTCPLDGPTEGTPVCRCSPRPRIAAPCLDAQFIEQDRRT